MQQLSLFDRVIEPQDPKVAEQAKPRLSRQCQAILARLRRGSANNAELGTIAMRFSARIFDLRKAGFKIETFDHDHLTGVVWYRLG